MLTIINQDDYADEKKQLERMMHQFTDDIQLRLSKHGHTINIQGLEFKLNYNTPAFQRLLKTKEHGLLKALGKSRGTVLDAFGGIGKDGFIMAHAGFEVETYENNNILYLLLSQAMDHYQQSTPLNWHHHFGSCLAGFDQQYDIVYLDPMFEPNRSAKAKKGMQIIQSLVTTSKFTAYDKAYASAKKRLIIKTHQSTPRCSHLPKPSLQISGQKNFRFDIYIKS